MFCLAASLKPDCLLVCACVRRTSKLYCKNSADVQNRQWQNALQNVLKGIKKSEKNNCRLKLLYGVHVKSVY